MKATGSEEIVQEKITGTKADIPELNRLLDKLRKGDVILVANLTKLSRNTKDLFNLVEQIEKKAQILKTLCHIFNITKPTLYNVIEKQSKTML